MTTDKFCLLLWKNYRLRMREKTKFLMEICLPAIFMLLLVLFRMLGDPVTTTKPFYFEEQDINLDSLRKYQNKLTSSPVVNWELAYSPKNDILHRLVEAATASLDLKMHPVAKLNANELELYMQSPNQSLVGIEFPDVLATITLLPKHLKYALRFPLELRCKSGKPKWSNRLYPKFSVGGPRNVDTPDGDVEYIREGFLAVQDAISKSFIKMLAMQDSKDIQIPDIKMKRMPYPAFEKDPLLDVIVAFVPIIFLLSFSYPADLITKQLLIEKEKQLKEVMKIMGLPSWLHWISWFTTSFLIFILSTILIVIVLKFRTSNSVAVLKYSDPSVIPVFFLCYACGVITFCFMASSLFKSSSTGSAASSLLFFALYMPYILKPTNLPLITKLFLSLFLNTGLSFATEKLFEWEQIGEGLQWSNLFQPIHSSNDEASVGLILLIILLTSIIQMLIALYLEKILPGTYGIAEKWYFPFTKNFWKNLFIKELKNYKNHEEIHNNTTTTTTLNSTEQNIGISIQNLTRTFNNKIAVDNLTLELYENEITVLLGHNGAGKTTTISMLTGMLPPTSGTAILNGYNIKGNLSNARKSIGLCPQYNILFDNLTVREHLIFYGSLKGLKKNELDKEVKRFVETLQLESKIDTISKDLSGGLQKKLSVCAALCGGSKVVFCDEPSSGMDASARHAFWKLLQAEKKGRTILLSTHYMDEADALGDKIAILNAGKLVCCGTSFALKKEYGIGYHLVCVKKDKCITRNVTNLLEKYIPNIVIELDIALELSYQLPIRYSEIFHRMLQDLENNLENLKLEGFGISMTTLEEVFLKAGAENHNENDLPQTSESINTDNLTNLFDEFQLYRGHKLFLNQCKALIYKKIYSALRNFIIFFIQNGMAIFFITTALISSQNESKKLNMPNMNIEFQQYTKTNTILESNDNFNEFYQNIGKYYEIYGNSFGEQYTIEKFTKDFEKYILDLQTTNMQLVNSEYIIACTMKSHSIIAWFNNQLLHTSPLSLNMIHNAILRAIFTDNSYSIEVSNKPLPYSFNSQIKDINTGNTHGLVVITNIGVLLPFIATLGIYFLVKEQRNRAKLLQYLTGLKVYLYWLIQYLFDIGFWLITITIIIIVLICFQEPGISTYPQIAIIFLLLLLFGMSFFPLTYLASMLTKEPATAYGYMSTFCIFTGLILYLVCAVLGATGQKDISKILVSISLIFPQFNVLNGLSELFGQTENIRACTELCPIVGLQNCTMDALCLITEFCCVNGFFAWQAPGIGKNIFSMIICGLIFFTILLLKEYRILDGIIYNIIGMIRKPPPQIDNFENDNNIDSDVLQEKRRVKILSKNDIEEHSLVLRGVTKYYKNNFVAVKSLSLGIKMSECFGLLGINGAGKTTTFKMMTGDESITYGEAYVTGINIKTNLKNAYEQIGYCPQFDGLIDDLTGRQTIHIFCLLRGIPQKYIEKVIETFSEAFGYKAHLNKLTFKCSGGTKRKISTTLALVGKPSIVFLDEPTSGMDPGSRRIFWDIINTVRRSGVALILTSHSMDECEALCTRLAIMVNGEFRCIGSIQHLKNKFAQGLILKIKLKPESNEINSDNSRRPLTLTPSGNSSPVNGINHSISVDISHNNTTDQSPNDFATDELNMKNFVAENFPNSVLKEQYQTLFTYYIPTSLMKWSEIFRIMEDNKARLHFEDYSICQTSLEQIFIELVREQLPEDAGTTNTTP